MTAENTNIQHLLSQVSAINKKYEQIAEITGENFNVFKILGLTTNEVRTHSAFIAELLDPKGSHGCKDAFLKLFIEKLQESIKEQTKGSNENGNQILERIKKFICSDKCKAYVEYYIGEINEDRTVGGRIDILLRDQKNYEIIIENKIYAFEQENQLIRYSNYNKSAPIIYLTLKGDKPTSAKSLYEFKDFLCISYKDDILNWLDQCLMEAEFKPLLRETITQYINLIKHLTNQTMNDNKEKDIVDTILNSNNIESAIEISKSIDSLKKKIIDNYREKIIAIKKEDWIINNCHNFGKANEEFIIYKENWTFSIRLYFRSDFDELAIGVWPDKLNPETQELIREKLCNFNLGKVLNWGNWIWISEYNLFNDLSWDEINNGELADDTIKRLDELMNTLKEIN